MTHDKTSTQLSNGDTSTSSSEKITTISPSTNQPILTRDSATSSQIEQLPQKSRKAYISFRKSHPNLSSRIEILNKFLGLLSEKCDVLSEELTTQMGRPIAYTPVEIKTAIKRAQYLIDIAPEVLSEEVSVLGKVEPNFKRYLQRSEPLGVILVIFAWNYPYLILVNSLVPAILAGNAVILKPSPQTPTIAEHVVEMLEEAGLPKDVVQYVHAGKVEDLKPLIQSPQVDHICFTGSVAGGQAVQRLVIEGGRGIRVGVGLELGGKDPAYVREDFAGDQAGIKWAAEEIIDGAIFNSGQSCCAIERVYVHEKVYDDFLDECKKVLEGYKVGNPSNKDTQIGPVVSKRAKDTILKQVSDAVKAGAKDETPANSTFSNLDPAGNYVAPVLLSGVNHEMGIMMDETFGPVVPVQKVCSDEEAIRLMNDSQFGLTASIWTKDVSKGEELVPSVEAGTVFVNRADYPSPDLAWTGWKDSGKGVTLSRFGFEQFVKVKSVHIKNYPNSTG
ncbi:hypothetical protein LTS08_003022 [Lithohypha guttulata]|uniref:aldehyde dehydrogenase (NAD(+)) n=1 Tax=Lithohypha guttulata TaxID=1690604 RepID=A0AAN7SZB2_9EURO|nr:hypothetical protein LTR51_000321 [Lithohypha guttulata]KAK5085512.1 hypothetical protein LTR05_004797 [Lithohypha guttulata]KAK5103604.1 hypothetical protein LTS08_003022 [Lithohypha guttulata]